MYQQLELAALLSQLFCADFLFLCSPVLGPRFCTNRRQSVWVKVYRKSVYEFGKNFVKCISPGSKTSYPQYAVCRVITFQCNEVSPYNS